MSLTDSQKRGLVDDLEYFVDKDGYLYKSEAIKFLRDKGVSEQEIYEILRKVEENVKITKKSV